MIEVIIAFVLGVIVGRRRRRAVWLDSPERKQMLIRDGEW